MVMSLYSTIGIIESLVLMAGIVTGYSGFALNESVEDSGSTGRFFYIPVDGDGIVYRVDKYEPVDTEFLMEYASDSSSNEYFLYTRGNHCTAQELAHGDGKLLSTSNFHVDKVTVFLVHGWRGHRDSQMNEILTSAFLQNNDVNVIVFDWSCLARKNYITAKKGVMEAGRALGQFINWLSTQGLSYQRIHLVGFSLGGHVVGNAGRETGSKVRRITSLDPAGVFWSESDESRIQNTDGQYVEVIHTSKIGYYRPCGDADFYPNGGLEMPGCFLTMCSHYRAFEYMASSIKYNNLLANECKSHADAGSDTCDGDLYAMGNNNLYKSRSGIFRVNTKNKYPY